MRRRPVCGFGLIVVAGLLLGHVSAARANATGGREIDGAYATMIRSDLTRDPATAWSVPSGNWEYEWIGVGDNNCGGCVLQIGYMKYAAGDEPPTCPSGSTNGVIKLEFMLAQGGTEECFGGIAINEGDDYASKVLHGPVGTGSQCDASHWCIYFHSDFAHEYSTGFDASAYKIGVFGEFSCASCMTSTTAMRVNYGQAPAGGTPWQYTAAGVTQDVTTALAPAVTYDTSCSGSSNSLGVINPITTGSKWDVYWKNGGTNC